MRYVSIDLETSGLNPKHDVFLELAAVVGDTCNPEQDIMSCPAFHCVVKMDRIAGHPKALAMNARVIRMISEGKGLELKDVYSQLDHFIQQHADLTAKNQFWPAGKNFASFDTNFLSWECMTVKPHFRSIDPAMFFWNPCLDLSLPDLSACCHKGKVSMETGELHNALYDARLVVQLVNNYTLMVKRDIPHPFL